MANQVTPQKQQDFNKMDLAKNYFFDGIDTEVSYGMILTPGAYGELNILPGAWPNEDRKLAIPAAIYGKGEVDFWTKFNAFKAFLSSGNEFVFQVNDLNRRFKVKYESVSGFKMLSKSSGFDKIGAAFTLNLIDDYPDVFTYTRTGSFIKVGTATEYVFKRMYSSFSLGNATELGLADANFNADGQKYANTQI